jgi:predicted Zn-dependent protease
LEAARGLLELESPQGAWGELGQLGEWALSAPQVLALRVEIFLAEGRPEHARIVAEGASELHPEAPCCQYALVLALVATGDPDAAREVLEAALAADPGLSFRAVQDPRLTEFWQALGF